MAKKLPITTYGMKVLREVTKPVTDIDHKVVELVENMFFTMKNADGIGLAAPQVNELKSIIMVDISIIEKFKDYKPIILINPEILDNHGSVEIDEGCLSIPELRGKISRPETIFVSYYDINMKEIKLETSDMLARVIQHEIDHLHGILFTDHLPKEELKKIKRKLNDIKRGKIITEYPILINSFS
jgi:peptide deformylase